MSILCCPFSPVSIWIVFCYTTSCSKHNSDGHQAIRWIAQVIAARIGMGDCQACVYRILWQHLPVDARTASTIATIQDSKQCWSSTSWKQNCIYQQLSPFRAWIPGIIGLTRPGMAETVKCRQLNGRWNRLHQILPVLVIWYLEMARM